MNEIYTTELFDRWFAALRDRWGKRRIQARIDMAEDGNFGDCKSVGQGVFEMRVHHGPGYRVYVTRIADVVYVLLAGGDKSTQPADIARAQALTRQLNGSMDH